VIFANAVIAVAAKEILGVLMEEVK